VLLLAISFLALLLGVRRSPPAATRHERVSTPSGRVRSAICSSSWAGRCGCCSGGTTRRARTRRGPRSPIPTRFTRSGSRSRSPRSRCR
jgi:hypothetical protein